MQNELEADRLKDACGVFEFYRAKEIIALGERACAKALDEAGL